MQFPLLAKISTRYRNFQQDIRRISRLCSQPSEGVDTFTNNKTNRMKSKDQHMIPDSREHLTFNTKKMMQKLAHQILMCESCMGNFPKSPDRQTHRCKLLQQKTRW